MKKILLMMICLLGGFCLSAQKQVKPDSALVTVYCKVQCVGYNLFKGDVNAMVDFGIADTADSADGWIYDTDSNKKMSFSSKMNVLAYMSRRGWEYKDALVVTDDDKTVWHFILEKKFPAGYTPADVIGDIDYRTKSGAKIRISCEMK